MLTGDVKVGHMKAQLIAESLFQKPVEAVERLPEFLRVDGPSRGSPRVFSLDAPTPAPGDILRV